MMTKKELYQTCLLMGELMATIESLITNCHNPEIRNMAKQRLDELTDSFNDQRIPYDWERQKWQTKK